MKTEVLIIGGGITGILTAYMLQKRGISYLLIEAEQVAAGTTRNTTAKITAQHGLVYQRIISSFGEEKAGQYLRANLDAVRQYQEIIDQEGIDCGFERISTYLYAKEDMAELEKEYEALKKLGYQASYTDRAELPFSVKGCIGFDDQAQCDPLRLVQGLSEGLNILEHTRALSIEGNAVHTTREIIYAHKIIMTVHFPYINIPGLYFMRMHQERSYTVALEGAGTIRGAYLGVDGGKYSFRGYKEYVLLGGCGHRSGSVQEKSCYDRLIKAGRDIYPGSREVCRWSAEDCMTHDGIPYIGKFSSAMSNVYVATGFNKWGMSTAMAAAEILSDEMSGKKTAYTIFSPARRNFLPSLKGIAVDVGHSAAGLARNIFCKPPGNAEDLERGMGGIVMYRGAKCGVYKDGDGKLFIVSVKCPHLGCQLEWNQDTLSWDCPCHGSSFDYLGRLKNGPAQKGIRISDEEGGE